MSLKKVIDTSLFSTLEEHKQHRFSEIDNRTGELIQEGFVYASKTFSMSSNAQINLSALNQTRDELTYPISYNTIDNNDLYSVVDATDVHNMYLAALNFKKNHLDSGTLLKQQIRDAVDESAVYAVIDNR